MTAPLPLPMPPVTVPWPDFYYRKDFANVRRNLCENPKFAEGIDEALAIQDPTGLWDCIYHFESQSPQKSPDCQAYLNGLVIGRNHLLQLISAGLNPAEVIAAANAKIPSHRSQQTQTPTGMQPSQQDNRPSGTHTDTKQRYHNRLRQNRGHSHDHDHDHRHRSQGPQPSPRGRQAAGPPWYNPQPANQPAASRPAYRFTPGGSLVERKSGRGAIKPAIPKGN
ncbi:hypothetical protein F5Y16DRAFT_141782 [Xylariaceae sp. FL0255]|nr:hypothetical protein F5Y16DRAFT_141782 [Xylariaceae sp. FL0255]